MVPIRPKSVTESGLGSRTSPRRVAFVDVASLASLSLVSSVGLTLFFFGGVGKWLIRPRRPPRLRRNPRYTTLCFTVTNPILCMSGITHWFCLVVVVLLCASAQAKEDAGVVAVTDGKHFYFPRLFC